MAGADALTAMEADMSRVAAECARRRAGFARRGLVLDEAACVALAAADALLRHPLLNSYWDGERLVVRRRIHLAIMPMAGPVRIVHDAQELSLRGVSRAFGRGPSGDPDAHALDDHTFTIVHFSQALWGGAPPIQGRRSAALGIGATQMRPVVVGAGGAERIAVRSIALLTLAYDARVLDQCQADAFLRDLRYALERFAA